MDQLMNRLEFAFGGLLLFQMSCTTEILPESEVPSTTVPLVATTFASKEKMSNRSLSSAQFTELKRILHRCKRNYDRSYRANLQLYTEIIQESDNSKLAPLIRKRADTVIEVLRDTDRQRERALQIIETVPDKGKQLEVTRAFISEFKAHVRDSDVSKLRAAEAEAVRLLNASDSPEIRRAKDELLRLIEFGTSWRRERQEGAID